MKRREEERGSCCGIKSARARVKLGQRGRVGESARRRLRRFAVVRVRHNNNDDEV
jgi:hypothetical protein